MYVPNVLSQLEFSVTALIPPEIWPVIRQANSLTANGCANPSDNFATYSFNLLNTASLLPADVTDASNFRPCDYLPEIQEALGYTPSGSSSSATDVTFINLVVLPQPLLDKLGQYFGADVELNGGFLLNTFGTITLRRLLSFIGDFFSDSSTTADRRKLEGTSKHLERSQVVARGSVMQAVRETIQPFAHSSHRMLTASAALFELPVNDILNVTFDFNLEGTSKMVKLGCRFNFESGDTAAVAIKGA